MMKRLYIWGAIAAAAALAACATINEPPTAEQRAACEKMLEMGEGATHSHSSDKSGTVNTMSMTHAQCRQLLGK
ncbi:MAG: hydroxylase [Phenylobacterium sp.]|uniref:hydroxylase n=1 Tax=Phenylobacterium sp. TaxID=1871053 RepID=UPI002719A542|nr:hydroxylase [Phenylobacterium sp.]MDO8410945.1 hydroxylase [Phenylobacterium sp.]